MTMGTDVESLLKTQLKIMSQEIWMPDYEVRKRSPFVGWVYLDPGLDPVLGGKPACTEGSFFCEYNLPYIICPPKILVATRKSIETVILDWTEYTQEIITRQLPKMAHFNLAYLNKAFYITRLSPDEIEEEYDLGCSAMDEADATRLRTYFKSLSERVEACPQYWDGSEDYDTNR